MEKMDARSDRASGMRTFIIIWIGQIFSLLGTAISHFGIRIWAYEASGGKATPLTWIGVAFTSAMIIFTPLVGVLVDRANRKLMMMLSDLAAAFASLALLLLFVTGALQVWHLYIIAFIAGTFQGFQWPAYSAAISTMLDKKHYTRANAMLQMVGPASNVFAPMIASALLISLGQWITTRYPAFAEGLSGQPGMVGLLAVDLASAASAIGTLLVVHIPQPEPSESTPEERGNFWQQAKFGFQYIFERPSLLSLQLVFLIGNFFSNLGYAVFDPMILARTDSNTAIFGTIQTVGALGAVGGGLVISAWGGFKRRTHGVLLGWSCFGIVMIALGMGRSLAAWIPIMAISGLFGPLINASNQAIWQAKVPPDKQGRVFASRRLIAWAVSPLSQFFAGPVADRVFEPLMSGTVNVPALAGWAVGTGEGAGMGLQFVLAGLLSAIVGFGGYLFPTVRNAEDMLPDHDEIPAAEDAAPDILDDIGDTSG